MIRELEKVVLLKLNVWFGEGSRLAKQFAAQSVPTFLLLDAEGALLSQWRGYDKASFLVSLGEGLAGSGSA